MNVQLQEAMTVMLTPCVLTRKDPMFVAAWRVLRGMVKHVQVKCLGQVIQRVDNAIQWINPYPVEKFWENKPHCVPGSDLSAVWRYTLFEQLGPVLFDLVTCAFYSVSWTRTRHFISNRRISLFFLIAEELTCDPVCTGNKVCRNYTGDPECVCADGFTGEEFCKGMLENSDFR